MREKIGFWILGLCNNFAYVVMLSSAMDILNPSHNNNMKFNQIENIKLSNETYVETNPRDCNPISTGAVLLADIIPAVIIKLLAPFMTVGIHFRVVSAVILTSTSFILVGLSYSTDFTFAGIVCASLASGLGEVSFLASMARFQSPVISYWSSGTGAAGVSGALTYATLTGMGLSPRTALLGMLFVPFVMVITFWCLVSPKMSDDAVNANTNYESLNLFELGSLSESSEEDENDDLNFHIPDSSRGRIRYDLWGKFSLIPSLLRYMIPLGLVYFFEYLINQGLFELMYFPNFEFLNHKEQYRWYQAAYQIGVFLSRSSLSCFPVRRIWVLSVLQFVNFLIFLLQAIYLSIPFYWIVLCFVLWEGLLGGCGYVNTFANIRTDIRNKQHQEFALGFSSLADSVGIALSGLIALRLHAAICNLPIKSSLEEF